MGKPIDTVVINLVNCKYYFDDVEKAISVFLAIHIGFNIRYTEECKVIWTFVQKYIAGVNTNKDGNSNETLAADLGILNKQ